MTARYDAAVFGLGYVGLPTAIVLALSGKRVLGVDNDDQRVRSLASGNSALDETELDSSLLDALGSGFLSISTRPMPASTYIICVPTPLSKLGDRLQADMSSVNSVVEEIAPLLVKGDLVILESTSPVGTIDALKVRVDQLGGQTEGVYFAYCPERVLPGNVLKELRENPRIVGGDTQGSAERAADFYRQFTTGRVNATDSTTAELAKLVENSYRDVAVAFANEVSMIASSHGVSDLNLISLVNQHPRVEILQPGVGVGGHCVAVDPWFLINSRPNLTTIARAAREVNDAKASWIVSVFLEKLRGRFQPGVAPERIVKVLCLGLSYKPDSADLRESRSLLICKRLQELGFDLVAVEPHHNEVPGIRLKQLPVRFEDYDFVLGLVAHREFLGLDFSQLGSERFLDFAGITDTGTPISHVDFT